MIIHSLHNPRTPKCTAAVAAEQKYDQGSWHERQRISLLSARSVRVRRSKLGLGGRAKGPPLPGSDALSLLTAVTVTTELQSAVETAEPHRPSAQRSTQCIAVGWFCHPISMWLQLSPISTPQASCVGIQLASSPGPSPSGGGAWERG